jgi:hypothetical protein
MKKLNKLGISSLLLVLMLAAVMMLLFSSMGSVFSSLNRTTSDLKRYTTSVGAYSDVAQMISQAYLKAKSTSPPTPPACDSSSAYYQIGSTGMYLCIPNQKYCSQFLDQYCLASPTHIVEFKESTKEVYVVRNFIFDGRSWPLSILLPHASAAAPAAWLPDISAGPLPTLNIVVPVCDNTVLTQKDCIRCDNPNKNAECFKVRICTNSTNSCSSASSYIEPVFAIQTSYGP